jgi:CRISPR/Cas system CSM-associated protein Csm3 (group 7 of RAMP superfamily)
LQVDYLGGGGTRGSGRVAFKNFKLVTEYAEGFDEELIKKITGQLKDVTENAELLY